MESVIETSLKGATFEGLELVRGIPQYPIQIEINISNGNSMSLQINPATKNFNIGYSYNGNWSGWKEIGSWT